MTVSSTTRKAGPFTGNGVTTAFPFTFKVFAKADIEITKTVTATGAQTVLVLDSDYSVTLNADQDNNPGGTITYPLAGSPLPASQTLVGIGVLDYEQSTDISNLGNFLPQVFEDAFDRQTILTQQLSERVDRALTAPVGDTATSLVMPSVAARASKGLGFDSSGNPVVYEVDAVGVAAAVAAAQAAQAAAEAARNAAQTAETNAETAETNAETAEANAETAEANAETAQAATELARDQSYAANRVKASAAAGQADGTIAVGDYFYVISAADRNALELWQKDGGTGTDTGKRTPAIGLVHEILVSAGIDVDDVTHEAVGSTTPNTSTASAAFLWSTHTPRTRDSYLTKVAIRASSAGTGKILVVDAANDVISDTDVTIASGLNTFYMHPLLVPEGGRVFFYITSGTGLRFEAAGTSYSIAAAEYSGSVGDNVGAAATQANVGIALECTFAYVSETLTQKTRVVGSLSDSASAIAANTGAPYVTYNEQSGTWAVGVPAIARFEAAFDAGTDLVVGSTVRSVVADLIAQAPTDHFRVRVYERATSGGDVQADTGADTLLDLVEKTYSELGLTLGAGSTASVSIMVAPFVVRSGYTYHVVLEAFTAANALITYGIGNLSATETRQRRRGWYTDTAALTTGVPAGSQSSMGFACTAEALIPKRVMDRVIKADATISGMDVTVAGLFERNGVARMFTTTQTIAAATGANIRYDTIYYDQSAGTFGVQSGTERADDPSEMIPTLSDPKRVALINTRATAAAVTTVPVYDVFNGEVRSLGDELEAERKRGRLCLQNVLGKLRRGAAVKLLGFGDSIIAIADSVGQSQAVPDGTTRDLPAYYSNNIGSDLVNAYTLVTNLSLGRADDGGGAIHITQGFMWELYRAMLKSGSSVLYNNFGVAGTTSADAAFPTPTAWLNAAVALAPDVVVINFGMNEIGNSGTEDRMVTIIETFVDAGIDVIVMGCQRPRSGATVANWELTNRALHRAALYAGAAFVPMLPLYDADYLGALGITTADLCSANAGNHPGFREHVAIGRELVKLVMGAA